MTGAGGTNLEDGTVRKFLSKLLLDITRGEIYVCSLVNDRSKKDGPVERHILTRDLDYVEDFVAKFDQAGRGMFFSVSTFEPRSKRVKELALESCFAYCDIDLKSIHITLEDVVKLLKALPKPPTFVVFSGNGVHVYWRFKQALQASEDTEEINRLLADIFAGDRQVAQRAALLRLPGSHNTKNGKWTPVEILLESDQYYEITDLADWAMNSPVLIERKDKPAQPAGEPKNPFLQYAEQYGFKPPIDVEQRLAQMQYQGPGETSVHETQVAVTASMLSAGHPIEHVVETVLEATKAIAPADWNWKEEEKTIRAMCQGWMRKLAKKEAAQAQSNVVNLNERRLKRVEDGDEEKEEEQKAGKPKKGVVHQVLGAGFIDALKRRGDGILLCREEVWKCTQGLWTSLSPGEAKAWIDRELEEGCRALGVVSTQKIINEGRAWIMRNPEIYRDEIPWDEHGKIATRSGLLDPKTLAIEPIVPEHYVSMRIECEYDPSVDCNGWKRMLADIFPDDTETTMAIQEIAGVGLILNRPRQLMRALILVGQSNSGKSNLLTVLSGMFTNSPNTTTFDLLENTHGTTDFLRNVPWVLHEAFDQSKWHFSATVKALLSGDPININIKNGPIVERRYKLPVFWGTNAPPQFKESSRAIENRIRIVKCKQVFDPAVTTGIAKEAHDKGYASPADYVLDTEMPGLLNWFLEGMKRAMARGYLADTAEMRQASTDLRINSNFMIPFLEDAVVFSSTHMVSISDFHATLKVWWEENRGEGRNPPSSDAMIKAIDSLYDGRVITNSKLLRHNTKRYIAGVMLNETGMEMWKANFNATAVRGDSARISSKEEDVNKKIPEEWYERPIIKTMVEVHNEARKKKEK